jgi:hypothetical protein
MNDDKHRGHLGVAMKLLLTMRLIVTLGGCVNTKPGDTNAPEAPADRRPI